MPKRNLRYWLFSIKAAAQRLNKLWRPYTRRFGLLPGLRLLYQIRLNRPPGLFSVRIPGYRARVFIRGNTADYKVFEEVFLREAYRLPEVSSPRFIIDAGANVGYTSVFFVHAYPEASVIAVEPERENYEVLLKNTNSFPQVQTMQAALWSQEGSFQVTNPGSGSWGFQVEEAAQADASEAIPGVTLNALAKHAADERIDLIKMDVEGAERNIFASNTEWLQRTDVVIMELHDNLIPGCRMAVESAVQGQNFQWLEREGHVILRQLMEGGT